MTEREAYIAANMAPGIGAVTASRAVSRLGSVASLFDLGAAELAFRIGMSADRAEAFAAALRMSDYRAELRRAEGMSVSIITPVDDGYPAQLLNIAQRPLALYVAGDVSALSFAGVGVVGTRAPSLYGRSMAKSMSCGLAQSGITVISGLARGIDTESHKGALLGGGRTVAVLGSSLDLLYPEENRGLAEKIVSSGGAVVSEFPFGHGANRQTFPIRNRIISGLSCGVLVIEAGNSSGTLITSDLALEQGRPVMAVPGRADCESAHGSNRLIKEGARLVETVSEVIDEISGLPMRGLFPDAARAAGLGANAVEDGLAPALCIQLDDFEKRIMECLSGGEMSPDDIVSATGLPAAKVNSRITGLEMKNIVERLPGNILRAKRRKGKCG